PGDKVDGKELEKKKAAAGEGKDKNAKGEPAKQDVLREAQEQFRAGAMPAGGGRMAGVAPQPPPPPFVRRQYAPPAMEHAPGDQRSDFVETLYWHPALVLPNGKGEVSFNLCDSVTTFQVAVVGHTLDGRVGAFTASLQSQLPFTLEPKLPI